MSNFSDDPEKELIKSILNGETGNYRILVDRYAPMIFHLVRSYIRDEEAVEDIVQTVFVKVYDKLDTFNFRSKFSSWLYQLSLNHCRDYLKNIRRKNIKMSDLEPDYLNQNMIQNEDPQSELEVNEMHTNLWQAIEKLPLDYREAIIMKYQDNMTYVAMSKKLGVSVEALKVRVHRARNELRTLMDKLL